MPKKSAGTKKAAIKKPLPKPAAGGNSKFISPSGKQSQGSITKGGGSKVSPSSGRAGGSARGK